MPAAAIDTTSVNLGIAQHIGDLVKPSFLKAILTDTHFWAPVVVLILGLGLLAAMR
jgi:hypothetical protein